MSLLDYVSKLEQDPKSADLAKFEPKPASQDQQQPEPVEVKRVIHQDQEPQPGPAASQQQPARGKLDNILDVLQYCKDNSLPARVVGTWVWVKFPGKPAADVRQGLKTVGFRWSRRRGQWAHNCGHPCRPSRAHTPWAKYETTSADDYLGGAA